MVVGPAAKLPPDHLRYDRHSIPSKFIINQRVTFLKILRVEWNNSISEVCTNQLCILEVVQDSIWPMRHCKPLNSHLQISVCLQPLCIKFNLSLPSSVHLVFPKNMEYRTCASMQLIKACNTSLNGSFRAEGHLGVEAEICFVIFFYHFKIY